MSVNPHTLNNLYQQGILDFVPMDLCYPAAGYNGANMQNPYLNSAMQGNLYQQYGNGADSFVNSSGANYYNTQIGSQNAIGSFMGEPSDIGTHSANNIPNMFGFNGTGSESDAGISMFGATGIGGQSNVNMANSYGGFNDVKNGINRAVNGFMGTPTFVKGIAATGLILLTLCSLFKGKKPSKNATQKLSKWNPLNWFKKNPTPAAPKKTGFFTKVKTFFKK